MEVIKKVTLILDTDEIESFHIILKAYELFEKLRSL